MLEEVYSLQFFYRDTPTCPPEYIRNPSGTVPIGQGFQFGLYWPNEVTTSPCNNYSDTNCIMVFQVGCNQPIIELATLCSESAMLSVWFQYSILAWCSNQEDQLSLWVLIVSCNTPMWVKHGRCRPGVLQCAAIYMRIPTLPQSSNWF